MKTFKCLVAGMLLFPFVASVPAKAAGNDNVDAILTIQGGALGVSTLKDNIDFGTITINGAPQVKNAEFNQILVEDFTGTGNGWNITVGATRFANDADQLPANSLVLETGSATVTQDGTTSASPTGTAGPLTLDSGSAVKVLSAVSGAGMGKYRVDFAENSLKLTVDTATVKAKSSPYKSIVTWTIVSGP